MFRRGAIALTVGFALLAVTPALAQLQTSASNAIIYDYDTGDVLYCKNCQEPMPPSSMSKLMTVELVFQRLKDGRLKLTDTFHVSEAAWRQGQNDNESKMWVALGSDVSIDDLLKWGEWASQRAGMCLEPDAEFNPGEKQCLWCKAKPTCRALLKHTESVIMAAFDDIGDLKSVSRLTEDEMARALDQRKLILGWFDAIEEYVTERLESGKGFTGYKLVAGRSLRQWGNDEVAEVALFEILGDDAFTRKLVSPAQAEKALGKQKAKMIESLIVKPEGKPTLAPMSDSRPAVNITADDF